MRTKICLVFLFTVSFVLLSCDSSALTDSWFLEWQFLNIQDSTANIKSLKDSINIESTLPCKLTNDSLGSNGHFVAEIIVSGRDRNEFPTTARLHIKLRNDTLVAFDSTFKVDELDFKLGQSSLRNSDQYHVSNKTFYIKVP